MNNEEFLSKTGLTYYHNRVKTVFASQADLDALDTKVDDIIAEGGEPNVIETVKVDGQALTPDAQKAVNIDLSGKADKSAFNFNQSTNALSITAGANEDIVDFTPNTNGLTYASEHGQVQLASKDYVDTNGGKIQKVKVNGTALPIDTSDKSVDVTVPTKTSDLTNDENFQTDTEVEAAIDAKITSTYKPGGTVAFANLPALTSTNLGKVYDISDNFTTTADFVEGAGKNYPAGTNVAIIEVSTNTYKYDVMAGFIDQSALWAKNELTAITTAEIDALFT